MLIINFFLVQLTGVESTIRLLQDLVTELRTTVKNIETENAALKAKLPDICTSKLIKYSDIIF